MRCRRANGHLGHCILSVTGLGCAAIALFPVIAEAQQPEDLSARQSVLEEIIVTARRRSETLQDVPGAVSAFSDTLIGDLQADDISGLQYAVPNLYLEEGDASNAVIFLRGVGQNDSLAFVESGVAVYVDDVFISRTQAAFLDLFDVERVEVLRGPQGTLYGRNSPGGAIKFISTAPPD
ncbi:TonB-dependent receptor plug domain-containing protein [Iodidimonas muriae]|uniref:TonB-dependent receptor plug domain-containing protein n=1 Tax=Iodidimonas muriae TaxID=261467 RepID=UPI001669B69A|nr:TonB-dependent receptor [Iodidimonas muriae]